MQQVPTRESKTGRQQTLWSDSNTICDYSSRTSAASYFFGNIFLILSSPNSTSLLVDFKVLGILILIQ